MNSPKISIVIPTLNRSKALARTLRDVAGLDAPGVQAEIVVVDNNSDDDTKSVTLGADGPMRVRYLFEARRGQSCAINRALGDPDLGEIVVVTDDDVTPDPRWLEEIARACAAWPGHNAFGGNIEIHWPMADPPAWAEAPGIRTNFGGHDLGGQERPYPAGKFPFGANFWVRRRVLEEGFRFDESHGVGGPKGTLGNDNLFHKTLCEDGHEIIYCPTAIVWHRVRAASVREKFLYERSYQYGRTMPHLHGVCQQDLLAARPWLWQTRRQCASAWAACRSLAWRAWPGAVRRVRRVMEAQYDLGYNRECLALAHGAAVC